MANLLSRNVRIVAGVAAAAALVGGLIGWYAAVRTANAPSADARMPDLDDARRVAAGRRVYDAHCAACHGTKLEGQPEWKTRRADGKLPAPPHDDSGHTWHHPSDVLFAITKNGLVPPYGPANYASDMPAFGGRLSDEEIWSVLAYIRSRWSDRIRRAHADLETQWRARR